MKPIALFYHVYMSGGVVPVNPDNTFRIVTEQVTELKNSGLIDAATHVIVGVAGNSTDRDAISMFFDGYGHKASIHTAVGVGELPTMKLMHDYAQQNPEHLCCYIHTKGAIHNGNAVFEAWRRCMSRAVVHGWRKCVADLTRGFDTVGAHWLTPAKYSFIGPLPYWGGNFFWARAAFLNELPPIDVNADRYQAEVWIGKSKRKPNVLDYVRHFPMSGCQL